MVRIIVADEHALYRTGLRVILHSEWPEMELLEAADPEGLIRHLMEAQPVDLALVSLSLSPQSEQIISSLKRAAPATRYVALAADPVFDQVLQIVADGFQGVISKRQRDSEVFEAISDLLAGRLAVPHDLAQPGPPGERQSGRDRALRRSPEQNAFGLTPRQKDVLELLADGLSNREISLILHIAEPTTKIHVSKLMRALNVRNRTEAAVLARDLVRALGPERDADGKASPDKSGL
jgi:DNA-binding NarL/FixJ family response regulator